MMELKELYENIEEAYDALEQTTYDYRTCATEVIEKENEIDVAKAGLYESGVINGKNAEIRDAQVKLNLNEEFEELEFLKQKEADAKLNMELVSIRVAKLRALLRIEEIIANSTAVIGFEG